MPPRTLDQLLNELDELKRPAGPRGRARLRTVLAQIRGRRFSTAASLIRFHEILLFMCAYPQGPSLLRRAEAILSSVAELVDKLRESDPEDLGELGEPTVAGIAGTSFDAIFSYDIVRWLAGRHPARVSIAWDNYEKDSMASVLPLLMSMLDENLYVNNFLDLREWLTAARGRTRELVWLVRGIERLEGSQKEKAALFDSQKLVTRWELGDTRATRTHMRRKVKKVFYHDAPFIARRDISLALELEEKTPLPLERLTRSEGQALLDLGREIMTVRFRELYGFTHGDPNSFRRVDAGRGVEIYLWGVPPERRFPTIAYHAMLIFKNGVPCGYAEGLTLFERTEVGLNIFYTFREGESAWLYARVLRLMKQTLGALVFSAEPYQLGFHNAEGIDSGAFWFYRKLGFRPVLSRLEKMAKREELRIENRAGYRTPKRALRELATGHMLYEAPSAAHGDWDRFHLGNLGVAAERQLSAHGDNRERAHRALARRVERELGTRVSTWNEREARAFEDLSPVLALIPDLNRWTNDEKRAIVDIVRAKASPDEIRYLRLLQKHRRLRRAIIALGSRK